jgi:WD40 repeat protein
LQKAYDTDFNNSEVLNIRPLLTLNEDYDYVRTIDYSNFNNTLFSAADNGIVRMWDINVGKVIAEQHLPIDVIILFFKHL